MPPKKVAKAAAPSAADFNHGDIVLTKLKGYPEWPGKVIDQGTAPPNVLQQKGGKPILVRFYPDADYVWTYPRDLRQLTTKIIDAYLSDPSKKAGKLKEGYEIARDPVAWDEQQATRDEQALKENEAAEDDDVDMLAEDGDAKGSKKRKRGAETGVVEKTTKSKAKKEPAAKAKKEAPASKKRKTDEPAEKKAKADKSAPKDKKEKAPSAAPAADDDNSEESKTVKGWRAHLQKAFLTKGVPTAQEMPKYDTIFTNMENFEMQPQWLASSKLGKVLKKMAALTEELPRDSEFHIKERSNALMEKWKTMLGKEPASATAPTGDVTAADDAPAAEESTSATNGTKDEAAGEEESKTVAADTAANAENDVKANGEDTGVNAEGQTNGVAEDDKAAAVESKNEEPAAEAPKEDEKPKENGAESEAPAAA